MMKRDPILRAFPLSGTATDEDLDCRQHGMTLRDYFAAKAMQAFAITAWLETDKRPMTPIEDRHIARFAYELADAMLSERDKSQGSKS